MEHTLWATGSCLVVNFEVGADEEELMVAFVLVLFPSVVDLFPYSFSFRSSISRIIFPDFSCCFGKVVQVTNYRTTVQKRKQLGDIEREMETDPNVAYAHYLKKLMEDKMRRIEKLKTYVVVASTSTANDSIDSLPSFDGGSDDHVTILPSSE